MSNAAKSLFRHKVLKLLLKEKRISEEWVKKLLGWRNLGEGSDFYIKTILKKVLKSKSDPPPTLRP